MELRKSGMRRACIFILFDNAHNIYNVSTTVYIKSESFIILHNVVQYVEHNIDVDYVEVYNHLLYSKK